MPVPETDAGGRGENPETDGRTLVKDVMPAIYFTSLFNFPISLIN